MSTETENRFQTALKEIFSTSATRTVLSVFLGFVVGAIFMVFSNEDVLKAAQYFTARPMDTIAASWSAIADGYSALFRGAIYNYERADDPVAAFRPITETLRFAAPLIAAGLGIALGFRVGLFNIGGNGQLMFGVLWATWISTRVELPFGIHLVVAILMAILGAALLGALVGFLKARTGAHEVIVTIMLNYIAANLLTYFFREESLLRETGGGGTPKSDAPAITAQLPKLLGEDYTLHLGFALAIIAVVVYWWLMERSTIGYRFRMVGHNPHAARTAGINVERTYMYAMAASAAFVGIAAANQALGATSGLSPSVDAGIGFDGITVALLGGSTAPGVLMAGLLFGAFKAGSAPMQVMGLSPEVLGIVQGSIVLFIAAPPLVRAIFRLPKPQKTTVLKDLVKRSSKGEEK
ncbi:nucleoside ABC transporter membrane protein [Microbacteriaceae bacterium MWH-Ta3]|nr:nucleoside ABC transporter membrane protein [Microbacteriaceae bacterium MWH-Ta3]